MEIEKKLVYAPPLLEDIDKKLVLGDIVPGASPVLPPDEDPDF